MINLAAGTYFFDRTISLSSNTILCGDSTDVTKLIFDLGGKGNCINISGQREKKNHLIHLKYIKTDELTDCFKVYNAAPLDVGLSSWGKESFGKIVNGRLVGDTLFTNTVLYSVEKDILSDSVYCYRIMSVDQVIIRDLTIERADITSEQTATIFLQYARNCLLINLNSYRCNYSHVTVENSYGCKIIHSKFSSAFSHGNGGKGYGVTLQFGATYNEISGCLFDSLRHGLVLQLGANTNWIVENYFTNGFWEDVRLPKKSAGDIVLHGNYPFMNFIEGNICNNIVIDNSHGLNGPNNLFQYNKTLLYGIYMNKGSVSGITYILENEIVKNGCLKGRLKFNGNDVESCDNTVNGRLKKNLSACEHTSTKDELRIRVSQNRNDALEFFGITLPVD